MPRRLGLLYGTLSVAAIFAVVTLVVHTYRRFAIHPDLAETAFTASWMGGIGLGLSLLLRPRLREKLWRSASLFLRIQYLAGLAVVGGLAANLCMHLAFFLAHDMLAGPSERTLLAVSYKRDKDDAFRRCPTYFRLADTRKLCANPSIVSHIQKGDLFYTLARRSALGVSVQHVYRDAWYRCPAGHAHPSLTGCLRLQTAAP